MTDEELNSELKNANLSIDAACDMMYERTKSFIRPDSVRTRIRLYRELSAPMSVAFYLFFRDVERTLNA